MSENAENATSRTYLSRLWVLMLTVFVDMMGFLIVLPLLPFYAERLGADPTKIGALVSVFALAQLAVAPLWGRLSDRYGRRPMIIAGLAIFLCSRAGAFTHLSVVGRSYPVVCDRCPDG